MFGSPHQSGVPYWRLSGFYFFYFAVVGLYMPFWPLYLDSLGLDAKSIGIFFTVTAGMRIIAPSIWGWLADHRGRRMLIIRLALVIAVALFTGMALTETFSMLLIMGGVFGFFWAASLPQFEATTLSHLGESTYAYTRIRIWGSIGFILIVFTFGKYFESQPIGQLPWLIVMVLTACMLNSLVIPESVTGHLPITDGSIFTILKKPPVIALLLICTLMQFSHAPYYAFYSIYLEDNGYSKTWIGAMWGLGVVAEIGVFMIMRRLIQWLGLRQLLLMSLLLAGLRWWMIGMFVDNLLLLIVAQLLHAATFGIYHATLIQFIHRYFPGRFQGRGQALYSSLSFGLGIAMGSLASGIMWELAGPNATFLMASIAALVGYVLCWKYVDN